MSTSNEADLELADFIDWMADDDATSVIALYMEGLRHPDRFRAAALKAARRGKPVVVFKIGRSASGAAAAVSHTGGAAALIVALTWTACESRSARRALPAAGPLPRTGRPAAAAATDSSSLS